MRELLIKVYENKRLSVFLKILSHVAVAVSVVAYALMLFTAVLCACTWPEEDNPWISVLVAFIVSTVVPFVIVTLVRKRINAPRPYELYDFYEVKPKNKYGCSYPSRHVFSAFVIATLAYGVYSPILGIPLFILGIALALSRVLLGIHFTRDVVAGALIGIISGLIGILLM